MSEITISLNNIQNIKTVNIDGAGLLHIRRMGSGEDLDISFKRRRINKLIDDLNRIDFTGLNVNKEADLKKMEKLSSRAESISNEIAEIKQSEFDIYKRLLSDDKNGEVVDLVMNTLTEKERAKLFLIAFGEKTIVETQDAVKPDDGVENE